MSSTELLVECLAHLCFYAGVSSAENTITTQSTMVHVFNIKSGSKDTRNGLRESNLN